MGTPVRAGHYDLASETATALSTTRRSSARPPPGPGRHRRSTHHRGPDYPALERLSRAGIPVTVRGRRARMPAAPTIVLTSEIAAGFAFTWRVVDNGRVTGQVRRQRAIREMNEISPPPARSERLAGPPADREQFPRPRRPPGRRSAAAVSGAEQNVNVIQRTLAEGLSSQLEFRTAESSFIETKPSSPPLTSKYGARGMGPRHRPLFSIFRRHRG